MLSVFVSGLERKTGKTVVTAGLAATMQSLSYSTGVYKPIQTGAKELNGFKCCSDINLIKTFDPNITTNSTYIFTKTDSPVVSCEKSEIKVDINTIFAEYQNLIKMTDCNILEGSNSISAPISRYITELDMIKVLKIPLLLVVNPLKTSIESLILGLKYIQSEQVNMQGVIINQFSEINSKSKDFIKIIKDYSDSNILGVLPDYKDISNITPEVLISDVLNNMDVEEIFGLKIAKLR